VHIRLSTFDLSPNFITAPPSSPPTSSTSAVERLAHDCASTTYSVDRLTRHREPPAPNLFSAMSDIKEDAKEQPGSHSGDEAEGKILDTDALKLAEMGYTQDMNRNFSVWSVLGVGFSLTNSWFGISAALVTGINSGGPLLIVYGIILIAVVSTGVGISLSELASALPNAGGQYFWANELAPRRYANFASYLTGWFAWAGSIFTSASVALAMGSALLGCWQLGHPDL
jgi:choline transport protein